MKSPVTLNMNKPVSVDDVRALIASVDDDRHWQLHVMQDGTAFLNSEFPIDDPRLLVAFSSFAHGTDHVGVQAAKDDEWVGRLHKVLVENWPEPLHQFIDFY